MSIGKHDCCAICIAELNDETVKKVDDGPRNARTSFFVEAGITFVNGTLVCAQHAKLLIIGSGEFSNAVRKLES